MKYDALRPFFDSLLGSDVTLTFSEIEKVLGEKLPPSAYKHPEWWVNSGTKDHSWSHHWIKAGWKSSGPDLEQKTVRFIRSQPGVGASDAKGISYWWVSHGKSYRKELAGGYIWCPQVGPEDTARESWVNVSRVRAGDVIFSYAKQQLLAIGVAKSAAYDAVPRAGYAANGWRKRGWEVAVEWTFIEEPIRPKDHIVEVSEFLPSRHSPLKANGEANMFYLSSITNEFARWILDHSEVDPALISEHSDLAEIQDRDEPETQKARLQMSRIGQGIYRKRVLALEKSCRLTGVSEPLFLIASHIKPWKPCNDRERLDGNNGLMLSPHLDKLFDKGWIAFSDSGDLLVSDKRALAVLKAWGIPQEINVGRFSPGQCVYLDYHRREVFGRGNPSP